MSSNKCSRCEQTVYPVEGLRCLDKIWHKGCFKCQECNMTLSLKNYKGFEKRPYCNAHCPQAKATTVVDTPEQRRLAENTRIQSQAKYHEDFEKSKGKITAIADDPETVRLKQTSKIISNVAYHGELERKKQMEEKRKPSGSDEDFVSGLSAMSISGRGHNNNHSKQGGNNNNQVPSKHHGAHPNQSHVTIYPDVPAQHQQSIQQQQPSHHNYYKQHQQQNNQLQKEMHLSKQKQHMTKPQHQQLVYPQGGNNVQQPMMNQSLGQPSDGQAQHLNSHQDSQAAKMHMMHQQHHHHNHHHSQQQLAMRQNQMMMQQQQQNQHQQQHQQHRHSLEAASMLNSQPINKQYSNPQINKHQQPLMNIQQHSKYMPINDPSTYHHQPSPTHLISGQMISPANMPNGQRLAMMNGPPPPHMLNPQQMVHQVNGGLSKQHQQQMICVPQQTVNQRPIVHPNQMHQQSMNSDQQLLLHQQSHHIRPLMMQQQMPRRVFRAMYDYVANDVDEVSFFENDILIDCVNVDGNWLMGKVARSGQTGMLPANYVAEFASR